MSDGCFGEFIDHIHEPLTIWTLFMNFLSTVALSRKLKKNCNVTCVCHRSITGHGVTLSLPGRS